MYTYTQQYVDLVAFFDSTCLYSIHIRPTSWLCDTICLWNVPNILPNTFDYEVTIIRRTGGK